MHAGLDQNVVLDGRHEAGQRNADRINLGKQAWKGEVAFLVGEYLLAKAILLVKQQDHGAHLRDAIATGDQTRNGSGQADGHCAGNRASSR